LGKPAVAVRYFVCSKHGRKVASSFRNLKGSPSGRMFLGMRAGIEKEKIKI
jgi:hypothetical protein